MKAYAIGDYNGNIDGKIIVFAETRGKAKAIAIRTDGFEDISWNEIIANRYTLLDNLYNGKHIVDWMEDEEITKVLLKEYGWACMEPYMDDCKGCEFNNYCQYYQDWSEEE